MKPTSLRIRKKGFTLIELLTVIAIIGILAGMISVVVPLIKTKAAQLNAGNNCKQIAVAYATYAGDTTPKNIPASISSVTEWAVFLAQKSGMNSGAVWFIAEEEKLAALTTIPKQVINENNKNVDPDFQAALPKAWEVVTAAPKNADGTTYPILWTRGLEGTSWSKTESPWGDKGGHIGYMDGHVTWVTDTQGEDNKGIFIDYLQKTQSPSIDAAIGSIARRVKK